MPGLTGFAQDNSCRGHLGRLCCESTSVQQWCFMFHCAHVSSLSLMRKHVYITQCCIFCLALSSTIILVGRARLICTACMFYCAYVPSLSLINPFAFAFFAENRERRGGGGGSCERDSVCVCVCVCARACARVCVRHSCLCVLSFVLLTSYILPVHKTQHSAYVPPLSLINPFPFASFAENREGGGGWGFGG